MTQQINYQNSSNMKKEILKLMLLGLQAKNVLTIENLLNALTNLSEKQQLQWIETMLQDENELSAEENKNFDNDTTTVLKVTQREGVSKLELIAYVKRLLDCPLKEAKDLIFNNNVFMLTVSKCDTGRVVKELRDNMHCIVEIT